MAGAAEIDSVSDVLVDLRGVIERLEDEQYQITDMSVGIVYEDGPGHSVPVELVQGKEVVLVAIGDPRRVADLDLRVFDATGQQVGQDELNDNTPVVSFVPPADGIYDVRVVVAESAAGYRGGFFSFATAFPIGEEPVSIVETFIAAEAAAMILESDGYQVLHGEWETLAKKQPVAVEIELPSYARCMAIASASSVRTRALDLYVADPLGGVLGSDKRHGELGIVEFPQLLPGTYTFVLEARWLRHRLGDTHAVLLVACKDE